MPPPLKVPPRRERLGWVCTETGSRGFAPSNHGLHYLPAFMAMFAFSHASFHAKLRFSAVLTLGKPVSERISDSFFLQCRRAILFQRTQTTATATNEHSYAKRFLPLSQSIDHQRHSVTDFQFLTRADFTVLSNEL